MDTAQLLRLGRSICARLDLELMETPVIHRLNKRAFRLAREKGLIDSEGQAVLIKAKYSPRSAPCARCEPTEEPTLAGFLRRDIRDTVQTDHATETRYAVFIELHRRRYRCSCGRVFPVATPETIMDGRRVTRDLALLCVGARSGGTAAAVARDQMLSAQTVQRLSQDLSIFDGYAGEALYVGLDTTKCGKNHILTLVDLDPPDKTRSKSAVADLCYFGWDDRGFLYADRPTLREAVARLLHDCRARQVSIDFSSRLKAAIKAVKASIQIVIDPFHFHAAVRAAARSRLFQQARERLPEESHREFAHAIDSMMKHPTSFAPEAQATLLRWSNAVPDVVPIVRLVGAVHAVYDAPTVKEGQQALSDALSLARNLIRPRVRKKQADPFEALAMRMQLNRKEILAYFDRRLTNAGTEAWQGRIKEILGQARGMNEDTLLMRLRSASRHDPNHPTSLQRGMVATLGTAAERRAKRKPRDT